MNNPANLTYNRILQIIRDWPPAEQLTLAHDILVEVATGLPEPKSVGKSLLNSGRKDTLSAALGLLSSASGEVPSDTEVDAWLDERRLEKYAG